MLRQLLIITLSIVALTSTATAEYTEPVDTSAVDTSGWKKHGKSLTLSWVSKDCHYRQFAAPPSLSTCSDTTITAWRGERISLEALITSRKITGPVTVGLSVFTDDRGRCVPMPGSDALLMRYVLTNNIRSCGYFDPDTIPAYTVAEMIDRPEEKVMIPARSVRPVWCTVEVPRDIAPGESRTSVFRLATKELAFWNDRTHAWQLNPGKYTLYIGTSSADIAHVVPITIEN